MGGTRAIIVLIWLVVGAIAAGQRGHYDDSATSCAETGTILVNILGGPLNYVGLDPKIDCELPQPSE